MEFLAEAKLSSTNSTSVRVTIPFNIVKFYKIKPGDTVQLEFVKNHRDEGVK